MTKRECAIVMAYTDICMLSGDDLKYIYNYLKEVSGESVWTHEIPYVCKQYRDRIRQDFLKLCAEATDD